MAYDMGYASGYAIAACMNYADGTIGRARFVQEIQRATKDQLESGHHRRNFQSATQPHLSATSQRVFAKCYVDHDIY